MRAFSKPLPFSKALSSWFIRCFQTSLLCRFSWRIVSFFPSLVCLSFKCLTHFNPLHRKTTSLQKNSFINHQCLIGRGPNRWLSGLATGFFQAAITKEWLEEKLKEPLGMKRPNVDWGADREGLCWRESLWKPDSSVWKMQRGEGSLQAVAARKSTILGPFFFQDGESASAGIQDCISFNKSVVIPQKKAVLSELVGLHKASW